MARGNLAAAASILERLLKDAPPGHAGWSIPIDPALARLVGDASCGSALAMLSARGPGSTSHGYRTRAGAQCLGRHEFRLAFEPRSDRPSGAALFARAAPFVAPPLIVPVIGTAGSMPATDAFVTLELTQGGAVLSACHRSQDGDAMLMRLFNPDASVATIRVGTRTPLTDATRVDFLEQPAASLEVRKGTATVMIAPHAIATILIR